jgi:hypothetical protein
MIVDWQRGDTPLPIRGCFAATDTMTNTTIIAAIITKFNVMFITVIAVAFNLSTDGLIITSTIT